MPKKPLNILNDLQKSPFPRQIHPALATLVDKPPKGDEWLHEIKLDGYRILAFKKDNTRLKSRNNKDWSQKFPQVRKSIQDLPISNVIFDGEIVVLDEHQRSNFQLLQNSIKEPETSHFIYYIFDVLYYDQYDLTKLPLIERKKILRQLIPHEKASLLRYNDHLIGNGPEMFRRVCDLKLEGIVSKRMDSTYQQKRSKEWLKIKCLKEQEFVIGGYTAPQGSRKFFGSLLLGTFNQNHEFIYNGNVGTGFNEAALKEIYQQLLKNKTSRMPFKSQPPYKNAYWVKPKLVAEVEFTEWTREGLLRHPSFKGLRIDKPAKEIVAEHEVSTESIASSSLTNPNKIFYPEDSITKQEIANYYENISEWIVPHIVNRPLTLLRCPDGYKKCFFQKHLDQGAPSTLHSVVIKEKTRRSTGIYLNDSSSLMALAQLGVLEIHPWGSTLAQLEYPDRIIFDLDPSPDVSWKKVVAAAFEIKQYLNDYHLKSYVKSTGGKGLHVVIPIKPEYTWNHVKTFSRVFVTFLSLQHPDKYLSKQTKSQRTGKIFVDYFRNQRGATAIAPYSPRARIHAPVATPLEWDELTSHIKDTTFTVRTISKRLKKLRKDPWKDFFNNQQSLNLKNIMEE